METAQTFARIIRFLRKQVTDDKQQYLEHAECTLWLFKPVQNAYHLGNKYNGYFILVS